MFKVSSGNLRRADLLQPPPSVLVRTRKNDSPLKNIFWRRGLPGRTFLSDGR
jgi:hypothetical protein